MSDPSHNSSSASAPAGSVGGPTIPLAIDAPAAPPRRLGMRKVLLPFIPIVMALLAALVVPRFFARPPAPQVKEGDMLGAKAPDFSLRDAHKEDADPLVTLSLLVDKGPVLIIFYRGYGCSRCMGHLRQVASQIDDYHKAGVQVLAISPDTPANTRDSIEQFQEDFPFPLLSDRDDKIARAYGLESPEGDFLHGVFIIDQQRTIRFARRTEHPYDDAPLLLDEIKKVQNSP